MRRGKLAFSFIILSMILILSLSIISAGWFPDLFNKNKLTGNVIIEVCSGTNQVPCGYAGQTRSTNYNECIDASHSAYCKWVNDSCITKSCGEISLASCKYGCSKKFIDQMDNITNSTSPENVETVEVCSGTNQVPCGYAGQTRNTNYSECINSGHSPYCKWSGNSCVSKPCSEISLENCKYGCSKKIVSVQDSEISLNCNDSDGGKNYFIKGNISGKDYSGNEIVPTKDYCTNTQDYNLLEYYCENNQVKGITYNCTNGCVNGACIRKNQKDISKYFDKQVFLISDKNWKDFLQLVPLTTWTGNENCNNGYGTADNVCVYPTLIYHQEENSFDADSIIYFMQQYNTKNVIVIGSIPQELSNLLVAQPELGAGINKNQIKTINPENYLSYWASYNSVVYVEDNYETALMASTYASLINAPLIIKGTSLDNKINFNGKNVICIGNFSSSGVSCSERYNLEELQKKYIDETGTDKIILVNSNDSNIKVNEGFQTEKSGNFIYELYSKTSLASPILASAKHELIISTTATDYESIDKFIELKIDRLLNSKYDIQYLTILASPNAIQMSKETEYDFGDRKLREEVDNHLYGNLDYDLFQELAVGRIFSLTPSDISSYISRDLFYSETPKDNEFSIIWPPVDNYQGFPYMKTEALAIENIFNGIGLNSVSFISNQDKSPSSASIFKNKFMLAYFDHAWTKGGVYKFNTVDLNDEKVWLNSPLVFMEGCGSCAFELAISNKQKLFCANLLRRGAILDYGATVDVSSSSWDTGKMIVEELLVSENIGQAVKEVRNKLSTLIIFSNYPSTYYGEYDRWDILMGDPTFNPNLQKPKFEELNISLNKINSLNYSIDISFPEVSKNIPINYTVNSSNWYFDSKIFNYPLGHDIVRLYKEDYINYNLSDNTIIVNSTKDYTQLVFSLSIPNGYSVKQVKDVIYTDKNVSFSVKRMPVFGYEDSSSHGLKEDFDYVSFAKDEGVENNYYFFIDISYGGNPSIIKTQDTIPEHTFKIYLELEEE